MLAFKDFKLMEWLGKKENSLDPILVDVIRDVDQLVEKEHMKPVITSLYREPDGSSGVHTTNPLRAADFRSHGFNDGMINRIVDAVNNDWCYDPNREAMRVMMHHDVGKGAHFHIQVHPNTQRCTKPSMAHKSSCCRDK